jgi:hypothetical protein
MLGLGREFTVLSAAERRHGDQYDAPHRARDAASFAPIELCVRIKEIGS